MTGNAERTSHGSARKGAVRQSAARLAAVQALYQIDHSGAPASIVLEEFLRHRLGDSFDTEKDVAPDKSLFTQLVRGVTGRSAEFDEMIVAALTERWTLDRLEYILRAILRAGVYELYSRSKTPTRVIISEYVDVAHAFYQGQEPGMVNGILGCIARSLRPGEFGAPEGGD